MAGRRRTKARRTYETDIQDADDITMTAPRARLSGGDVDADPLNAEAVGDEAVGGSTAMPDEDIVDAIGEALGVAQEPDAEVRTSAEILAERDARRWAIEREIARGSRIAETAGARATPRRRRRRARA
jgi:hypothetical protein